MCRILPVSHTPCTHTVSIWQHCVQATRHGANSLRPCWNVRQEERAVLTRKPCKDCDGSRFFARRGGVAERGDGSLTSIPVTAHSSIKHDKKKVEEDEGDGNDSGYHSDVIHEENESTSDIDERPLSPRTTAPQARRVRKRSSRPRAVTHKQSWKPNLKRDLSLEASHSLCHYPLGSLTKRGSIDSMMAAFTNADVLSTTTSSSSSQAQAQMAKLDEEPGSKAVSGPVMGSSSSFDSRRRRRGSTLLHPSSPPPMETMASAQVAKAFPFPQMIDVRRPGKRESKMPERKKSTLLHPSPPMEYGGFENEPKARNPSGAAALKNDVEAVTKTTRPAPPPRQHSSLLHPSSPGDMPFEASPAQHRATPLLSSRQQNFTLPFSRPPIPLRRMPPVTNLHRNLGTSQSNLHSPLAVLTSSSSSSSSASSASAPPPRPRKSSILHSSLSDSESESEYSQHDDDDDDDDADEGFFESRALSSSARKTDERAFGSGGGAGDITFALDVFDVASRRETRCDGGIRGISSGSVRCVRGSDDVEDRMLARSGEAARARRGRGGR